MLLSQTFAEQITIIGGLAFIISCLVQMTKNFIPKVIPTKLYTLMLGEVFTIAFYINYVGKVQCSTIMQGICMGIFVSYVAINGWDSLKELKDRFIPK